MYMSKAILVIDTPECCADCPCSFFERDNPKLNLICGPEGEDVNNVGVPDWCPLKSIPEKIPEKYENKIKTIDGNEITTKHGIDRFAVGYNKCIDDILSN